MTVHNLILHRWDESFHFASLDGEDWLPISRAVADTPEERERLARLFDGDGNFKPMRFARRFFDMQPDDARVEWL